MIDPMGIAGMIFVLLIIAMAGGFLLLLPLSRRLGHYLEQRGKLSGEAAATTSEIRHLRDAIQSLQAEVQTIAERQEFTDALLADPREQRALGSAGDARTPQK